MVSLCGSREGVRAEFREAFRVSPVKFVCTASVDESEVDAEPEYSVSKAGNNVVYWRTRIAPGAHTISVTVSYAGGNITAVWEMSRQIEIPPERHGIPLGTSLMIVFILIIILLIIAVVYKRHQSKLYAELEEYRSMKES
jgi:hypothetical protein